MKSDIIRYLISDRIKKIEKSFMLIILNLSGITFMCVLIPVPVAAASR